MLAPKKLWLSKSRYTNGLQCHKRLWLEVHEPDAPELEVDPKTQAVFDQGRRVGERACDEFAAGQLIESHPGELSNGLADTRDAIASGANVIFEASFKADDIFVAVDVLSRGTDGWGISEVKSTAEVKSKHLPDVAVQVHVLEKSGLSVSRAEVMHLNREHRHPTTNSLFVRSDVTERISDLKLEVPSHIEAQLNMLAGPQPHVEPGDHCTSPHECPFIDRCCDAPPDHRITELYRLSAKKKAALGEEGVETIDNIPSDFPLTTIQSRHRSAVRSGKIIVEPAIAEELAKIEYPITMLDFETVGAALPVWDGTKPFEAVPVQYSAHVLDTSGAVRHECYLASSEKDPRPGVAQHLAAKVPEYGTVLAWNASFEKRCLDTLATNVPALASRLASIRDRIIDLLPIVRNNVYHPAFHGSFSIKTVAPALVPAMSYESLSVSDGETASSMLEMLLTRPQEIHPSEHDAVRDQLLAYCNHDTAVMVELWHELVRICA